MDEIVKAMYSHKVRVRVCGLCFEGASLLMVKHIGLGEKGILWSPPGGGMEFGETAEQCLMREFEEETGLIIEPVEFLFVNEFKNENLHAIELFFSVRRTGGYLKKGNDPELPSHHQLIKAVKFVTFDELKVMPVENKHNVFRKIDDISDVLNMRGYFKFWQ
ncbi:NUDIX hydrolase [Fulvivirga sp. M361]|uniref:NUDIX domain-containing protein n=1 Tax=Fulvivirga sp. M361 TaxID=2594266 RepID=UPI00117A6303|nr:NUDIX domain-containing protein [Fulvivirga sp. M361]TRX49837.1 NUDIX hydrolase [Fulvivirga sp. M361]